MNPHESIHREEIIFLRSSFSNRHYSVKKWRETQSSSARYM
jgi:hypothetical protein